MFVARHAPEMRGIQVCNRWPLSRRRVHFEGRNRVRCGLPFHFEGWAFHSGSDREWGRADPIDGMRYANGAPSGRNGTQWDGMPVSRRHHGDSLPPRTGGLVSEWVTEHALGSGYMLCCSRPGRHAPSWPSGWEGSRFLSRFQYGRVSAFLNDHLGDKLFSLHVTDDLALLAQNGAAAFPSDGDGRVRGEARRVRGSRPTDGAGGGPGAGRVFRRARNCALQQGQTRMDRNAMQSKIRQKRRNGRYCERQKCSLDVSFTQTGANNAT